MNELFTYAGVLGLGGLLGAGILAYVIKSFVPAYFAEKGKNLATREDVEEITSKVEAIRSEYARQLQELAHQNTLLIEGLRGKSQLTSALRATPEAHS